MTTTQSKAINKAGDFLNKAVSERALMKAFGEARCESLELLHGLYGSEQTVAMREMKEFEEYGLAFLALEYK